MIVDIGYIVMLMLVFLVIGVVCHHMDNRDKVEEDVEESGYCRLEVSEPVITFVELVKANPKRFVNLRDLCCGGGVHAYVFCDKELKVIYSFCTDSSSYCSSSLRFTPLDTAEFKGCKLKDVQDLSWVTEDEWDYLYKHLIQGIYLERRKRYYKLLDERSERAEKRKHSQQRESLKKLYCEEK